MVLRCAGHTRARVGTMPGLVGRHMVTNVRSSEEINKDLLPKVKYPQARR